MAEGTIVLNPKVPFIQNVGSVKEKQVFYIAGVPDPNPSKFSFDFCCGNDIAFHMSVRFNFGNDRKVIVRNTQKNGIWGTEERSLQGNFPFKPGKYFDINICVETSCFKVALDNQPLFEFKHRIPFNLVEKLHIHGYVRITQVRF